MILIYYSPFFNKNNIMAKKTFYYSNPKRMLSCFLNELAAKDIEHTNKKIREVIERKRAKLR